MEKNEPYFLKELRPAKKFPNIQTVRHEDRKNFSGHNNIVVQYYEGDEPKLYCGDHWCRGRCGLPALVIPWTHGPDSGELKCGGNQVAVGAVAQGWRVEWEGTKVEMPEEYRQIVMRYMWW
jgi:hypothetical protein